jgi:pyruvate kinase
MNEILANSPPEIYAKTDRYPTGEPSSNGEPPSNESFESLITGLTRLQREAENSWCRVRARLGDLELENRSSTRNLIHYLSLRRHDIRELQNNLARNGISSLGRSESHVMSNLNKVLKLLYRIVDRPYDPPKECEEALSLDEGSGILVRRTSELLGPHPEHRKVRIMVTLPCEAGDDYALVRDLVAGGMDCARINCAHDGPDVWRRMVDNILKAIRETGRECKICFDIAGPKLRTGVFEPGPKVLKVKPIRDLLGRVVSSARIWVSKTEDALSSETPASQFTLPKDFIHHLRVGDKIAFEDARGASRNFVVAAKSSDGVWLEINNTAYIVPETRFKVETALHYDPRDAAATPGNIPATEQFTHLRTGDTLILTRSQKPGKPEITGPDGKVIPGFQLPFPKFLTTLERVS